MLRTKHIQQQGRNNINPHYRNFHSEAEKHFNSLYEASTKKYFFEDEMQDLLSHNIIGRIHKYDVILFIL
jgi:hypothetical protein